MPLERSLSVMIDLIDDERLKMMVEQVRDKVRGGGTLSDALEEQHVFSNMYTNIKRMTHEAWCRFNVFIQESKTDFR